MATRKRTGSLGMSAEDREKRRSSIGGSDAKIIMSGDQRAIERLWLEKRGECEPENLDDVVFIQMGNVTEDFNLDLFEQNTGYVVTDEQRKVFHAKYPFLHSTLDGLVRETEEGDPIGLLEAKFMLPFKWSMDMAIEKYFPQVQHNLAVTGLESAWLSVLTGSGQYQSARIEADFFYQVALIEAEKAFWKCVETGETPGVPEVDQPKVSAVRVIDMTGNNEWATLAADLLETKDLVDKHEKAKKDIKKLFADDMAQASGHGVTLARSKDGKVLVQLDKVALKEAQERRDAMAA